MGEHIDERRVHVLALGFQITDAVSVVTLPATLVPIVLVLRDALRSQEFVDGLAEASRPAHQQVAVSRVPCLLDHLADRPRDSLVNGEECRRLGCKRSTRRGSWGRWCC